MQHRMHLRGKIPLSRKADQELLCSPVYITYLAAMGVTVVAMLLVYRKGSQKLAYALVCDLAADVLQRQPGACVCVSSICAVCLMCLRVLLLWRVPWSRASSMDMLLCCSERASICSHHCAHFHRAQHLQVCRLKAGAAVHAYPMSMLLLWEPGNVSLMASEEFDRPLPGEGAGSPTKQLLIRLWPTSMPRMQSPCNPMPQTRGTESTQSPATL